MKSERHLEQVIEPVLTHDCALPNLASAAMLKRVHKTRMKADENISNTSLMSGYCSTKSASIREQKLHERMHSNDHDLSDQAIQPQ